MFLVLFTLFVLFYFMVRQKQNELLIKQQITKSEYEQLLLNTQLEIQEQTLKNISEEIHDNVGQVLSLAKLNLFTFETNSGQKLEDTKNLVSKAINDLRNLSRSMHGDIIAELGLQQSIANELAIIENTRQFVTTLKVMGIAYKLDKQKEMVLFRIAQEALNNCIKYSKAKNITVELSYDTDQFLLSVTDDGIGFDATNTAGIGLKSMQNRAALIGGIFLLHSSPGKGTTISIELINPNL